MRILGGCKFMTEKEIEVVMNALAGEETSIYGLHIRGTGCGLKQKGKEI